MLIFFTSALPFSVADAVTLPLASQAARPGCFRTVSRVGGLIRESGGLTRAAASSAGRPVLLNLIMAPPESPPAAAWLRG